MTRSRTLGLLLAALAVLGTVWLAGCQSEPAMAPQDSETIPADDEAPDEDDDEKEPPAGPTGDWMDIGGGIELTVTRIAVAPDRFGADGLEVGYKIRNSSPGDFTAWQMLIEASEPVDLLGELPKDRYAAGTFQGPLEPGQTTSLTCVFPGGFIRASGLRIGMRGWVKEPELDYPEKTFPLSQFWSGPY